MSEEGFNIFKTFATLDTRIVQLFIFILIIIITLRPLSLPMTISGDTRNYYDWLNKQEEGEYVLVNYNIDFAGYMELKGGILAAHKILIEKGVKMCITTSYPVGVNVIAMVFGNPNTGLVGELTSFMEQNDYTYGEDYIILGYTTFNSASVAAMAFGWQDIVTEDWEGVPVAGTFLDDIVDGSSWNLIVQFSRGGYAGGFIGNHFRVGFDTPYIQHVNGVIIPSTAAQIATGMLDAFLGSTAGGAELELLVEQPGPSVKAMDSMSMVLYWIALVVIIGNIGYFGWEKNAQTHRRNE
jgi:hypothetical protein